MSFSFNVMEIPGHFSTHTSLSLQYASGLMQVEGAYDVFAEMAKATVDGYFEESKAELKGVSQLSNIAYCDDTLWSIAPEFVKEHNVLLNNKLKQMTQALEKKLNEFSFRVKGFYGKIIADLGSFFGVKILRGGEVFVAESYHVGECDIVRYPHNYSGEHFLADAISFKEVRRRIQSLAWDGDIDADIMEALMEYYRDLKEGAIVVPSWNKRFVRYLGGCDYDGDGVIVITDERILALARLLPMCAIEFGDPKATDRDVPELSLLCKDLVYRAALSNPNDPVGVITNRGMGFTALSEKLKTISDSEFEKLKSLLAADKNCSELFINNEPYIRRYDAEEVVIDSDEVDAYWQEVLRCGMNSRENMRNIMLDAQPVTSSVGGRSIDSAKTGEAVFAPFKALGRIVKAGMIKDISIKASEDKEHALTFEFNPIETGIIEGKYIVEDTITSIKNRAGRYACAKLQQFYAQVIANR